VVRLGVGLLAWAALFGRVARAEGLAETGPARARVADQPPRGAGMSHRSLGNHWLTDVLASYTLVLSTLAATAVVLTARRWSGRPADRRRVPALVRPS
jgi:hypothetical protein